MLRSSLQMLGQFARIFYLLKGLGDWRMVLTRLSQKTAWMV